MKKISIQLSLIATLAITPLFATNGDTLIAVGAKSRGMGGAGIGYSHCAESTLQNPSLITCTKGTNISFGGTVFMPDVNFKMGQAAEHESAADMNVIPSVSISERITDEFFVGIGMWGTAGMGVDYRDAKQTPTDSGNMHMVTNLQLMQFAMSLAYKMGGLSIGISPVLQYGALDINYQGFDGKNVGDGISQDLSTGVNAGLSYEITEGVTVGAVYKSKIEMEYKNQLSVATKPFVDFGIFPATMANTLEQPAEMGVGIGYTMDQHTIALDYKQTKWSDAKGYKEFGWDDQNVVAVGYEFKADGWALRAGYNHADHPITEAKSGPAVIGFGKYDQAGGNALNLFNLLGFPATAEDHYTVGGSMGLTENLGVDIAYVYAPETEVSMKTIVGLNPTTGDLYTGTSTVKHAESSASFQLNYRF